MDNLAHESNDEVAQETPELNQETTGTTEPTETTYDLQDIKRQILSQETAAPVVQAVINNCTANNVVPVWGFDPNSELPANVDLLIEPLQRKVIDVGFQTYGVLISLLPTVDSILASDGGQDWVNSLITAQLIKQIKSSATKGSEDITSIPVSPHDFIQSGRSAIMSAYNELASKYVKTLKAKAPERLNILNAKILKKVLSSTAFAESTFVGIPQASWELVIKAMAKSAMEAKLDTTIFQRWLDTRDKVEIKLETLDLSDFEAMV